MNFDPRSEHLFLPFKLAIIVVLNIHLECIVELINYSVSNWQTYIVTNNFIIHYIEVLLANHIVKWDLEQRRYYNHH